MDAMQGYDEKAFSDGEGGNIYRPLNLLERLSHARKTQILNRLALPDISKATAVNYGVGYWGFGAVYGRLKMARHLIGIDNSQRAVEISAEVSAKDPELKGKKVDYRVSTAYELPLDDSSVDIFFAGECIEQIDDTESFLQEVYRCLRPGGLAILTTPNARPFIYRQLGLRWCVAFEHTALMDYNELRARLAAFFRIEGLYGFNQSFHPQLDDKLDEETARAWVQAGLDTPADATGLIACVSKEGRRELQRSVVESVESQCATSVSGEARQVELAPGYEATLLAPRQMMRYISPEGAVRCSLILWSHPWSGTVHIQTGTQAIELSLYSHMGGCQRITVTCKGGETITVSAVEKTDPRSQGSEVIVLRAVFVSLTS